MKKISIITLIFVLTATLFTGCRNPGNTTTSTTPAASSSTRPTVVPMPDLPLPTGTSSTNPGGVPDPSGSMSPDGTTGVPGRAARDGARGPRY